MHAGEHIAILIYKTLAVPEQESVALQALVQEIGIVNVSVGHTGVENLDILVQLQTIRDKGFFNLSFTANQNGGSQSCCCKAVGGADHPVLFAFGKYNALRLGFHLIKYGLKGASDGIKPCGQLRGVFINIGKMFARHA